MTKSPGFRFGNCMMLERLNKPEVEYLGPLLVERLKFFEMVLGPNPNGKGDEFEDARQEIRMLEKILTKMDYPFRNTTK